MKFRFYFYDFVVLNIRVNMYVVEYYFNNQISRFLGPRLLKRESKHESVLGWVTTTRLQVATAHEHPFDPPFIRRPCRLMRWQSLWKMLFTATKRTPILLPRYKIICRPLRQVKWLHKKFQGDVPFVWKPAFHLTDRFSTENSIKYAVSFLMKGQVLLNNTCLFYFHLYSDCWSSLTCIHYSVLRVKRFEFNFLLFTNVIWATTNNKRFMAPQNNKPDSIKGVIWSFSFHIILNLR